MSGMDYAGIAYCRATKKWTNLGYIKHKSGIFSFHKEIEPANLGHQIIQLPSQSGDLAKGTFKCEPGIGTVVLDKVEWVFLFGYFPLGEIEYLLNRNDQYGVNLKNKRWSLLKQT